MGHVFCTLRKDFHGHQRDHGTHFGKRCSRQRSNNAKLRVMGWSDFTEGASDSFARVRSRKNIVTRNFTSEHILSRHVMLLCHINNRRWDESAICYACRNTWNTFKFLVGKFRGKKWFEGT